MDKLFAFLATTLGVLLVNCSNPVQTGVSLNKGATGTLSISLPAVAAWGQNAGQSNRARAFGYATSATLEVTTAAGVAVIDPVYFSPTSGTHVDGINYYLTNSLPSVPAGSNYTVKVTIHNYAAAPNTFYQSNPTVIGQVTGVTVTSGGTTPVLITCVPASSVALTLGTPVNPAMYAYNELWYSIAVNAGSYYSFNQTTSGLLYGLFSHTGSYLGSSSGLSSWKAPTTETIYVCLLSGASSATPNFTMASITPANEGATGAAIGLTLNSPHIFMNASGGTSYYSFTTGSSPGTYALYLGSGVYNTNLYTDNGFTTAAGTNSTTSSTGVVKLTSLAGGTPYYLKLTSATPQVSTGTVFSVPLLPLPLSSTYTTGTLTAGNYLWYEATVTPGQTYTLHWKDSADGTGQTLNAWVSAYQSDLVTAYPLTDHNKGYTTGQTITIPAGQTKVYIYMDGYLSTDAGTFALSLQ